MGNAKAAEFRSFVYLASPNWPGAPGWLMGASLRPALQPLWAGRWWRTCFGARVPTLPAELVWMLWR
jgi:hypothetical protein